MDKEIKVNFTNRGIELEFLNGEIIVPNEPGGYVISSGCGSGKTTAIKDIIKQKWNQGILYSAATIRECNEMYKWIVDNLIDVTNPLSIQLSDIVVLHSDELSCEGVNMKAWKSDPMSVTNKKVLICTHAKLLNELPELLLWTNFNISKVYSRSHHGRAVTGYFDGIQYDPRKLILIDELPTYNCIKVEVDRLLLEHLGDKHTRYSMWRDEDLNERVDLIDEHIKPINYEAFLYRYNKLIDNDSSKSFFKGSSELDKIKNELILDKLYENFDDYISSDKPKYYVSNGLSDFILPDMKCRVLLFEGTGDLTFIGSQKFRVLNYEKKYNSLVKMERIPSFLKRRNNSSITSSEIYNNIKRTTEYISGIVKENEGMTLIVTWKNLRDDRLNEIKRTAPIKTEIFNEDFDLPNLYSSELSMKGLINHKDFEIIYYQSGLDRATNEFREAKSIIFLGQFHVPNSVIEEFNELYSCNTSLEMFTRYQLVQAICRTRIRNHKGESINVYYTDDWGENTFCGVLNYINHNLIEDNRNNHQLLDNTLNWIKPKWRTNVIRLMEYDQEFNLAIKSKSSYTLNISLDQIYSLIPMSKKRTESYFSLIAYLENILNIKLNVISEKRNQYSIQ